MLLHILLDNIRLHTIGICTAPAIQTAALSTRPASGAPHTVLTSIQHNSAGLSERHEIPRGPIRVLLNAMGMSSARGKAAISRT